MTTLYEGETKKLIRKFVPRIVRNAIRRPGTAIHLALRDLQYLAFGPSTYEFHKDWKIQCSPNVYATGYSDNLKTADGARELDNFIASCKSNMQFYDIGCHLGIFSLAAAHYGGSQTVCHAFDPSPKAIATLNKVAQLNKLDSQIKPVQCAVGALDSRVQFVNEGLANRNYFVIGTPKTHASSEREEVECRSLDSLVKTIGAVPTHIKIDVESYEAEVLKGAQQTLSSNAPLLFIEIHNKLLRARGIDPKQLITQLREFGYRKFKTDIDNIEPEAYIEAEHLRLACNK